MKKITSQKKLDERMTEIKKMSNQEIVKVFQVQAGWEYVARRDMRIELANNLYKDMELVKSEILNRFKP
jgi:hypothetical protein